MLAVIIVLAVLLVLFFLAFIWGACIMASDADDNHYTWDEDDRVEDHPQEYLDWLATSSDYDEDDLVETHPDFDGVELRVGDKVRCLIGNETLTIVRFAPYGDPSYGEFDARVEGPGTGDGVWVPVNLLKKVSS